jgi:glycosyltransferase involved in cell wall biosynthesis
LNRKIKVVDLFNTDYGAYRLLRTRVKKIDDDPKFDNYIICPDGEWSDKMKNQGLKIINVNISNSMKLAHIFQEIKELKKIFIEYKIDVVHTHASKPGATGRIAAKKAKVPLIIHQVHGFHFTRYIGVKRWIFEVIEKFLAKYSKIMLFQNKDEYNYCLKNNYNKKTNLKYIGNGIPFEEFQEYIGKEKKYNKKTKVISCIARWQSVKYHEMLFKAVKILKENYNYNDFTINLYGEGEQEKKLKHLAEKLKIIKNINFVGTLDRKEIIEAIYNSDLSVLSSYKEGKPRALMESSALGVPIVATDVIGTNEVVKDNKTGYLVKLHDYQSFAEAMYELLNNEEKWLQYSDNSKKVAKEEFDENNVIEQLKELYKTR